MTVEKVANKKFMKAWIKEAKTRHKKGEELLQNIKRHLPELESMWRMVSYGYEDRMYRYYHHSFKVYSLQEFARDIVKLLKSLAPKGTKLCNFFTEIINAKGAYRVEWEMGHNEKWSETCMPFITAFLHAKYFLEMAVKYGKELEKAPTLLPSGWAALLELYRIR